MAVIINATTTTGLTTSADNSGVIQFQSNGANTVGISSTGYITIGGNQQIYGPAFSAYLSASSGSVTSNTFTKIAFNTEEFDTANCYDNTTNYRFTPTVAGYYQVDGACQMGGATNTTGALITLYKNGSRFKDGALIRDSAGVGNMTCTVGAIIYFNGSTDYVEMYGLMAGTGTLTFTGGNAYVSYFSAAMIRGA